MYSVYIRQRITVRDDTRKLLSRSLCEVTDDTMKVTFWIKIFVVIFIIIPNHAAQLKISKKSFSSGDLQILEGDAGSGEKRVSLSKIVNAIFSPDDTEQSVGDTDDENYYEGEGSGERSGEGSGDIPTTTESSTERKKMLVEVVNNVDDTTSITTHFGTTKVTEESTTADAINHKVDVSGDSMNKVGRMDLNDQDKDDITLDEGFNFTVAIIVGVAAGSILSVLIIVLLIYRLRIKDKGSYF